MAGTRPESDSGTTDQLTELANALKHIDRDEDSRHCRHDGCHGTLTLTDDDRVVCESCRCQPDGVYLPPESNTDTGVMEGGLSQLSWFYPKGPRVEVPHPIWGERDEYDHSNRTRLAGGYERVYDEDDDHRPDGVTDEYTFDLSTL